MTDCPFFLSVSPFSHSEPHYSITRKMPLRKALRMEDDEKKNKFCNTASEMAKGISKAKRLSYLFLNYLADRAHYINVTDETIMRYIVKTSASRNPRADSEKSQKT